MQMHQLCIGPRNQVSWTFSINLYHLQTSIAHLLYLNPNLSLSGNSAGWWSHWYSQEKKVHTMPTLWEHSSFQTFFHWCKLAVLYSVTRFSKSRLTFLIYHAFLASRLTFFLVPYLNIYCHLSDPKTRSILPPSSTNQDTRSRNTSKFVRHEMLFINPCSVLLIYYVITSNRFKNTIISSPSTDSAILFIWMIFLWVWT